MILFITCHTHRTLFNLARTVLPFKAFWGEFDGFLASIGQYKFQVPSRQATIRSFMISCKPSFCQANNEQSEPSNVREKWEIDTLTILARLMLQKIREFVCKIHDILYMLSTSASCWLCILLEVGVIIGRYERLYLRRGDICLPEGYCLSFLIQYTY
jgi:hypothetical protein